MKKSLLFVAKGTDDCDDGFGYVLDLAKSINAGIQMLIVYSEKMFQQYEDIMTAVAFAEAGEHDTVRELIKKEQGEIKEKVNKKIERLSDICRENAIEFHSRTTAEGMKSAINEYLTYNTDIELILLSPNLTGDRIRKLKALLTGISRPVVAITRPAGAGL